MQPLDGDTSGGTVYLPGYDGTIKVASLFWVLAKLGVMFWWLSRYPLNTFEIILRLVLGVLPSQVPDRKYSLDRYIFASSPEQCL